MKGQQDLDRFVESLRADKKSENTIKNYKIWIEQMLQSVSKEPKDITKEDLNIYKHSMAKNLYNTSMIAHIAAIKSFFEFLGLDTATKLKYPKRPEHLPVVLSENEIARILSKARDESPMDYAIISSLYYGGLRISEVVNLNIEDIDFEKEAVKIRQGKGKKDGIVCFHKDAIKAIKAYLPYRTTPLDKTTAFFVQSKRQRIGRDYVWRAVKKYAVKAGINKRVHPHVFRHSLATHMIENGAGLLEVKEQLRHKSISATVVYTHITKERIRRVYNNTVHSFIEERVAEAKELQMLTLEQRLDTLETRFLKGEIPADIYRELKEKYIGNTAHNLDRRRGSNEGYA